MQGLDIGDDDPYEIGLKYKSKDDPRRDLVKQYVVAILNDKSGKYRLDKKQLNVLRLNHQQLRDMVRTRHIAISHHFGTGIGLHLQYIDSCVAESVMLKFIRKKEVCLPIHDSFIVRCGLLKELEMVMRDEFRKQLRSSIGLKKTELAISGIHIGQPDINLPVSSVPVDPVMDIAKGFMSHISKYSILIGLHSSWEKQVFSPAELEGRSRMTEERFDFGKRNPV